ncbi:MAG: hypothetical protein ACTHOI_02665 [Sphingomicrobium sp.]
MAEVEAVLPTGGTFQFDTHEYTFGLSRQLRRARDGDASASSLIDRAGLGFLQCFLAARPDSLELLALGGLAVDHDPLDSTCFATPTRTLGSANFSPTVVRNQFGVGQF